MGTKRRRTQEHGTPSTTHAPDAKRQHTTYDREDAQLASLYSDLADDVKATRHAAVKQILQIVENSASQEKVTKITTRLIRGLCSNRKAARLGFVVVLTEVIAQRCGSTVSDDDRAARLEAIVSAIQSVTEADEGVKNQEKRDYQLGRCLAYKAVIHSRVLQDAPSDYANVVLKTILDHIFAIYQEAPLLRQECGVAANAILPPSTTGKATSASLAAILLDAYTRHGVAKSAEGLAAWLDARRFVPDLTLPAGVWRHNDPFDAKERATLVSILKDNAIDQDTNLVGKASGGNAQRLPNAVWPTVLGTLFDRTSETDSAHVFTKFWTEVLNEGYFAAKASVERKAIGLQIFQLAIQASPAHLVPALFSPNIVRCIINQRSSPSNNLFNAIVGPLQAMQIKAKASPDHITPFITTIIQDAGLPDFDKLTRTKTLETLLSLSNGAAAEEVINAIDATIAHPVVSEHLTADASRLKSADLLASLARKQNTNKASNNDDPSGEAAFPWHALLSVLIKYAYFQNNDDAASNLAEKLRESYQTRLTSILTIILESKRDSIFENAYDIVKVIDSYKESESYEPVLKADETIQQVLSSATKELKSITKKVKKAKDDRKPSLNAFRLLFTLTIIQVYNGDADAVTILEDLTVAYQQWGQGEDTNTSATIIEILLGFLSRPSALFRQLAEQVFSAIATSIGEEGLDSLLEVLEKPENSAGQDELFANAADNEDVDMEDGSDSASPSEDDSSSDEDASDVEVVDAGAQNGSASSEEADSDEDDEDDEDDESSTSETEPANDDDPELADFESKLAQTLGTAKPSTDASDSDMDSDAMHALDSHLTAIFAARTAQSTRRKSAAAAAATVATFKNRVLDLLALYVRRCPASPLALRPLAPLLALLRATPNRQLQDRAAAVLRLLPETCARFKAYPDRVPDAELWDVLGKCHAELRRCAGKAHGAAAGRAALFVVRLLVTRERGNFARVVDMYAALQKEWLCDAGSKVPGVIFTEWASWGLNSRKSLA